VHSQSGTFGHKVRIDSARIVMLQRNAADRGATLQGYLQDYLRPEGATSGAVRDHRAIPNVAVDSSWQAARSRLKVGPNPGAGAFSRSRGRPRDRLEGFPAATVGRRREEEFQ
jgi:hypothetical protein